MIQLRANLDEAVSIVTVVRVSTNRLKGINTMKRSHSLSSLVALCVTTVSLQAYAVNFTSFDCTPTSQAQGTPLTMQVECTVGIARPGSARWYNAPGWDCPTFCAARQAVNIPSPDGFSCTSGEERPWSAIGVVDYSRTGCWHNCASPEGIPGAMSAGPRCYAPGQKRDNDSTDTTLGCYCASGDIHSHLIDVGIHGSGTAQVAAISHTLSGWTTAPVQRINDLPGRLSYVQGTLPLSGLATVRLTLNIQGSCGTGIALSARTNGSGGSTADSQQILLALPQCATQCSDSADNDVDGAIDNEDFACVTPDHPLESDPVAQCQNGKDDDRDGLIDGADPGCPNSQDNDEEDPKPECQDKKDNDSDGAIDFPSDLGCSSGQDLTEGDDKPECSDEIDNDKDGATDYPQDRGCTCPNDSSEVDQSEEKVRPIAECVEVLASGALVGHFGYNNTTSKEVEIAIGGRNHFSPGKPDRGQPKVFKKGKINDDFKVEFAPSENLKWVIGNTSAQIRADSPRCSSGGNPCVQTRNVRFLSNLDRIAKAQRDTLLSLTQTILSRNPDSATVRKAQEYRNGARAAYKELLTDLWTDFPQITRSCPGCGTRDLSDEIADIVSRSQKILRLSRQAGEIFRTSCSEHAGVNVQELLKKAEDLFEQFKKGSTELPRFTASCQ